MEKAFPADENVMMKYLYIFIVFINLFIVIIIKRHSLCCKQ